MNETDELLIKRFNELARRAYERGVYTYTDFLDMHGTSLLLSMRKTLDSPCTLFGGMDGCERNIAMFGSSELCVGEGVYPITCVTAAPANAKFADELSHRDFLGALMNLGVERDAVGDIILNENAAYIFCLNTVADYIAQNLTKVKHTTVRCGITDEPPQSAAPELVRMRVQCASERVDGVIARVYALSREDAQELFDRHRVFVNSVERTRPGDTLREGDIVSVRGFGRFVYIGTAGKTRKGKLNIDIDRYGG